MLYYYFKWISERNFCNSFGLATNKFSTDIVWTLSKRNCFSIGRCAKFVGHARCQTVISHHAFCLYQQLKLLKTVIFWVAYFGQTWKTSNIKFRPQFKDRKSSYQVKKILELFCKLGALMLGKNCVQGSRVAKIAKQINFKGVWGAN